MLISHKQFQFCAFSQRKTPFQFCLAFKKTKKTSTLLFSQCNCENLLYKVFHLFRMCWSKTLHCTLHERMKLWHWGKDESWCLFPLNVQAKMRGLKQHCDFSVMTVLKVSKSKHVTSLAFVFLLRNCYWHMDCLIHSHALIVVHLMISQVVLLHNLTKKLHIYKSAFSVRLQRPMVWLTNALEKCTSLR